MYKQSLKLKVCYRSVPQEAVAWEMMNRTVGLKPLSKRSKRKVSQSQTEDISNKKKPAELSVKATVISCERMQLYVVLTK